MKKANVMHDTFSKCDFLKVISVVLAHLCTTCHSYNGLEKNWDHNKLSI